MINASLANITNVTLQEPTFFNSVIEYVKGSLYPRFMELVTAPYYHKKMIWILIPMITVLILMELYLAQIQMFKLL